MFAYASASTFACLSRAKRVPAVRSSTFPAILFAFVLLLCGLQGCVNQVVFGPDAVPFFNPVYGQAAFRVTAFFGLDGIRPPVSQFRPAAFQFRDVKAFKTRSRVRF